MNRPEDVLDFGEDDEGLDVISLGGSDHNGEPLDASHPAYGTLSSSRSRCARSPAHKSDPRVSFAKNALDSGRRRLEQPLRHDQRVLDDDDRDRQRRSTEKPALRVQPSNQTVETSVADSQAKWVSHRHVAPVTRPKPGERASYMPPERLQEIAAKPRSGDLAHSKAETRRSSSTHPVKSVDGALASKASDMAVKASQDREVVGALKTNPAPAKTTPSAPHQDTHDLPKGWLRRVSRTGKTYYVNALTRTSQWAVPTEPASLDKPRTSPKPSAAASTGAGTCAVPAEQDPTSKEVAVVESTKGDLSKTDRAKPDALRSDVCPPSQPSHKLLSARDGCSAPVPSAVDIQHPAKRADRTDSDQAKKVIPAESDRHHVQVPSSAKLADKISSREEQARSKPSESHISDHRVHPDRIALANSGYHTRHRDLESSKALPGSYHREEPPQPVRGIEGIRRDEGNRFLSRSALQSTRPQTRPQSPSHVPPRGRSHERDSDRVRSFLDFGPSRGDGVVITSGRPVRSQPVQGWQAGAARHATVGNEDLSADLMDLHEANSRPGQFYPPSRDVIHPSRREWIDGYLPEGDSEQTSPHHRTAFRERSNSPPHTRLGYGASREAFQGEMLTSRPYPHDNGRTSRLGSFTRHDSTYRYDAYRPLAPDYVEPSVSDRIETRRRPSYLLSSHSGASHLPTRRHSRGLPSPVEPLLDFCESPKSRRETGSFRHTWDTEHLARGQPSGSHPYRLPPPLELERHEVPGGYPVSEWPRGTGRTRSDASLQHPPARGHPTSQWSQSREPSHHPRKRGASQSGERDVDYLRSPRHGKAVVRSTQSHPDLPELSSKSTLSLACRLGPVVCDEDNSRAVSPSPKRHKPNSEEQPLEVITINDSPTQQSPPARIETFNHQDCLAAPAPALPGCAPGLKVGGGSIVDDEPKSAVLPASLPSRISNSVPEKRIAVRGAASGQAHKTRTPPQARDAAEIQPHEPSGSVLMSDFVHPAGERRTSEAFAPPANGSLRERIQDLNVPPSTPTPPSLAARVRPAPRTSVGDSVVDDARQRGLPEPNSSPAPRHICERISGFRQTSNYPCVTKKGQTNRHFTRQRDSGWGGRQARNL